MQMNGIKKCELAIKLVKIMKMNEKNGWKINNTKKLKWYDNMLLIT